MAVIEDGHLKFRHFCRECSEIKLAGAPNSLQEMLEQLEHKEELE
jgi:hypothetical protein